jgi:UDP-N-acetylmuramyl pentapeptide synthase
MFDHMVPGDCQILATGDARLERLCEVLPGRRLWLNGSPGVKVEGVKVEDFRLTFSEIIGASPISLAGFTLPGRHNRENLAAAVLLALCGGVPADRIDVRGLQGSRIGWSGWPISEAWTGSTTPKPRISRARWSRFAASNGHRWFF